MGFIPIEERNGPWGYLTRAGETARKGAAFLLKSGWAACEVWASLVFFFFPKDDTARAIYFSAPLNADFSRRGRGEVYAVNPIKMFSFYLG